MLFKNSIPSSQIVSTAARRNKDYEVEFINAVSNNDVYSLRTSLRKDAYNNLYKIRAQIISNTLAYPALDMVWAFKDSEYDFASRVYHRICDEVDEVKENFDQSMAPITVVASQVRESLKPISLSYQEKSHMLPIDEAKRLPGEPDARVTIYRGQYPQMTKAEKDAIKEFVGNEKEEPLTTKKYKTREKY